MAVWASPDEAVGWQHHRSEGEEEFSNPQIHSMRGEINSSFGCWVSVAAIFILLISTTTSIESSSAFHRDDQYHHNSLFRHFTNFRRVPAAGYQRSVLPSPLHPGKIDQTQIDPRYETDERLVPGGPNPLHN
ncbi:hypothetical protein POM88_039015 [Heracleum sosnowskyi]|uniref:Uncharacterized protein n=1 Tax=Heracleum sosnowskyi TaxID=360622 RepID=A0AAD8M8D5_9APIA|nr:hypothetical protein POM88_039015 [Heracleum sosnowskyi]